MTYESIADETESAPVHYRLGRKYGGEKSTAASLSKKER
jgi:hypothetical protein